MYFEESFAGARDLSDTLREVVDLFERMPFNRGCEVRPKVVPTPYSDYLRIVLAAYFRIWFTEREFGKLIKFRSTLALVDLIERRYRRLFPEFVREDSAGRTKRIEEKLAQFNICINHEGESYENVLKIMHILEKHADISLFVQASPAFCCPALVTGVPVVTVTYDGTETWKNDIVVPYFHFAKERMQRVPASC